MAGAALAFSPVEPWPEPVDGADLLGEIGRSIRRYVVLAAEAAIAMALWIVHTFALDAAQITALLAILWPTKRCGKSTLLKLLGALVCKPITAANLTAAGLFPGIEAYAPTLLVDEADSLPPGSSSGTA
jgi:putative DNA primase/helicase